MNLGEKSDGERVAIKELLIESGATDEDILEKFHEFHHEAFIARHPLPSPVLLILYAVVFVILAEAETLALEMHLRYRVILL